MRRSGWYGDHTACNADFLGTGACGSGAKADCDGQYHTMECCRITDTEKEAKTGGMSEQFSSRAMILLSDF